MGKLRLPELPETGRRYVEETLRARLASPGVERYRRRPGAGAGARAAVAAVVLAALAGAALWLAR